MTLITGVSLLMVTGCGSVKKQTGSAEIQIHIHVASADFVKNRTAEAVIEDKETESRKLWSKEDLAAITQTLAGECYDDKEHDKRRVVEVILNRVSDGRFGETIYEVVSAKNQFVGYWNPLRPVSDSDIKIAEQTLQDWFDNDREPLSKYLYFRAGENRENTFYENIEW